MLDDGAIPDHVIRGRRDLAENILGFVFLGHPGEIQVKVVSKQLEIRI